MTLRPRACLSLLSILAITATACADSRGMPLESSPTSRHDIVDASVSAGAPGFYFLPPMVRPVSHDGTFDPGVAPIVDVCRPLGGACALPVLEQFSTTSGGPGSVRVDEQAEQYSANWHTSRNAEPGTYRIRIRVGGTQLGYADVQLVRNGNESKAVDATRYVAVVAGSTLPVKFRIEQGAVAPPGPPAAVPDHSAGTSRTLDDAGGTLSLESGGIRYTLTIPEGALLESHTISMAPLARVLNLPLDGGLAAGVDLQPHGLVFVSPATLQIEFPADVETRWMAGFTYGGSGADLHLRWAQKNASSVTLQLTHFSGAGAGDASPEALGALQPNLPFQTQQDAATALAMLQHGLPGGVPLSPALLDEAQWILREWYGNIVRPALESAATDTSRTEAAVAEYGAWDAAAEQMPVDLDAEQTDAAGRLVTALLFGLRTAVQHCAVERSVPVASKALRLSEMSQRLGLANGQNGLSTLELLTVFCMEAVVEIKDYPNSPTPGEAATLRVQATAQFTDPAASGLRRAAAGRSSTARISAGSATDADLPMYVTVTPQGTTDDSPRSGFTDASGEFATELTPRDDATEVRLHIRSCVQSDDYPRLNLLCTEELVVRSMDQARHYQLTSRARWLNIPGVFVGWQEFGAWDPYFVTIREPSPGVYELEYWWRHLILTSTGQSIAGRSATVFTLTRSGDRYTGPATGFRRYDDLTGAVILDIAIPSFLVLQMDVTITDSSISGGYTSGTASDTDWRFAGPRLQDAPGPTTSPGSRQ